MRASRILTRREIEGLIAAGDTIVIAEQSVLRLNGWRNKHPGGDLVLRHMVGRDATDEMKM
jgi:delta8-fatty-acid desaturase